MKIWSKLFLVAATGMMMFSSCLKNIEPEGIADLRGAKAELLRAETALTEAKAARENAEAAIALAKAKVEEAIAKQEEARAKKMEAEARIEELKAAKQEALDAIEIEQAIAEAEAEKAKAELEAQIAAANLENQLISAQTLVLQAKARYEEALKDLTLAMNGLTAKQLTYLKPYQDKVDAAQRTVDTKSDALSAAAIELKAAIANLDENKASAVVLRHYEKEIITLEASIKGVEEAVAIFEEVMELDPKYTDWAEKIAELEAEKEAKDLAFAEGATERRERQTELEAVKDTLEAAYTEYEAATGFAFDVVTGEFNDDVPGNKAELPYPNINIPSPKDEDGENLFDNMHDINWKGYEYYTDPATQEVSKIANTNNHIDFYYKDTEVGNATTVVEAFDAEIEAYETAADPTKYEANIAGIKATIKSIEDNNEDALAGYEAAVAAYKAGDPTSYFKALAESAGAEYDIDGAVADYNAALKAMVAALNTLNEESKKYDAVDNTDAVDAALELYNTKKNEAYAVYMSKRQAALNDYNKAKVAFQNAYYAYDRATTTYQAVLDAAIKTVGAIDAYPVTADRATVATALTTAIEKYATDKAAGGEGFDADGKYAAAEKIYVAELKKVNDAQKLYDDADVTNKADAVAVWAAAKEAYAKAGGNAELTPVTWNNDDSYKTNPGAYSKAVSDAKNAYYAIAGNGTADFDNVTGSAWETYQDTLEDLGVGATGMDGDYEEYLTGNYETAVKDLMEAIEAVEGYAKMFPDFTNVVMGDEDYYMFGGFDPLYAVYPSYLVDEKTQAFKEIKSADIIDKEYFLATTVKSLADAYAVTVNVTADYENVETGEEGNVYKVVVGAPADYPLSLPTYESYTKALEAYVDEARPMYAYAKEVYRKFANECVASGGSATDVDDVTVRWAPTPLETTFYYMDRIAKVEEGIANTEVAAEHVKVLEAAKAEFEAWAAEEEARIDALRPRVETEWMDVTAELDEIDNAQTAHNEEIKPINEAIGDLETLVSTYVKVMAPKWNDTTEEYEIVEQTPDADDLETFVAKLQDAYDKAVLKVGDLEAELEDAKTALEKAKAGEWTYTDANGTTTSTTAQVASVKTKQAAYDKAAAELEYALSRLAEATEALKAAMEAIGAVEPEAEETPAE